MMIRHALRLSTVAAVIAGGTSLISQVTTGALNGHVTDAKGNPLAGVRVTLESSALFQPRVLKTDAGGEYRALLLPVGKYSVKVSAPNYVGKTNNEVRIGVGANLTLDFSLKATEEASATVQVVADVAQTSKADDKVSFNVSAETLEQLPTTRSFDGALILAPGVTGSGGDAQVRGSGMNQINYRIDGIDVKDDRNGTQIYQPLQDSIEDVQVVLSALNARNGRSQGGQVNVVTKSGSNAFEGSIRTYQQRLSWASDQRNAPAGVQHSSRDENDSHYTDATFSGPLWKDRVWFYVGARFQPGYSNATRLVGYEVTDGPGTSTESLVVSPYNTLGKYPLVDAELLSPHRGTGTFDLPTGYSLDFLDKGQAVASDVKYKKYEGKITGMLTENHILTATYLFQSSTTGGTSSEGLPPMWTLERSMVGDNEDKVTGFTLGWNANLASNWTLEARLYKARHDTKQFFAADPGFDEGGSVYAHFSSGSRNRMFGLTSGGFKDGASRMSFYGPFATGVSASAPDPAREGNRGINLNVKTFQDFLGRHEIDFGGEDFYTVNNVGRARRGDRGVWTGGFYTNNSVSGMRRFLFPVYWTSQDLGRTIPGDGSANMNDAVGWNDQDLRVGASTMERFWAHSADTKNKSKAYWINDIWAINNYVNVMIGLRYNQFSTDDNNGGKLNDLKLTEPRFQIKVNPDGQGKNVFSFSLAKLASSFSDQIAANYRGNEWEVRTVHRWTGRALGGGEQNLGPDISTLTTGSDATNGVRWVDYKALQDVNNYGPAISYIDARQQYKVNNLRTPYAIEADLGFEHSFTDGFVRVHLVQRSYKDNVLQRMRHWGRDGMTLVVSPEPEGETTSKPQFLQNLYWENSTLDRIYRGLEISWQRNLSERLSFGGGFNTYRMNGYDEAGYYNYRELRLAEPGGVADGQGLLDKGMVGRMHLTYVVPVGKGKISASIMGVYYTAGIRSINRQQAYTQNKQWWYNNNSGQDYYTTTGARSANDNQTIANSPDQYAITAVNNRGAGGSPTYNVYYGPMGNWKSGYDQSGINMKLAATVPLGIGKAALITSVQIYNVFNHVQPTGTGAFYDWSNEYSGTTQAALSSLSSSWGQRSDYSSYTAGRSFGDFSIGLKF